MRIRDVNVYNALILGVALNFYNGTTFAMILLPTTSQKQSIKVHNHAKKEDGDIPISLEVAQKSPVIDNMLTDLGGSHVVVNAEMSIPLSASLKTISSTLVFPLHLPEEIEKRSLKNIIKQLNFLHSYDFPEYAT